MIFIQEGNKQLTSPGVYVDIFLPHLHECVINKATPILLKFLFHFSQIWKVSFTHQCSEILITVWKVNTVIGHKFKGRISAVAWLIQAKIYKSQKHLQYCGISLTFNFRNDRTISPKYFERTVLRNVRKKQFEKTKEIFYSQYQVKTIKTGKPKVTHYDFVFTNANINGLIS